ncbi:uncharacterized protein LOC114574638 isoform X2 [Exaiptasia diaphana]|uniref:Uncharacterized protein n=1 Tax=Exaiptasia diaphana TaxID=2652724 RepID=A0A913YEY1_EXADI|nr:uncharacterized protein LOC114574638 isoform X2 [Exaiptasia diaphana]
MKANPFASPIVVDFERRNSSQSSQEGNHHTFDLYRAKAVKSLTDQFPLTFVGIIRKLLLQYHLEENPLPVNTSRSVFEARVEAYSAELAVLSFREDQIYRQVHVSQEVLKVQDQKCTIWPNSNNLITSLFQQSSGNIKLLPNMTPTCLPP